MRTLKYLIAGILVIVIQSTLLDFIKIFGVKPDITVIFTVFVALRLGPVFGVFTGFLVGFTQDVYSWSHLGANALAKSVMGYVIGLAETRMLHLDFIPKMILLFLAYYLQIVIFFWAYGLDKNSINELFFSLCIPQSIYTFALGALFFHFYKFSGSHSDI
jgi:rod shape-determining protein MreD